MESSTDDLTEELAYALHSSIWDYSQLDRWPIVGDDFPACEVLAKSVIRDLSPPVRDGIARLVDEQMKRRPAVLVPSIPYVCRLPEGSN